MTTEHSPNTDNDDTSTPPPRRRNRTLAADGLPQEMFRDIKRACHRHLMSHDPSYVAEQERITIWCNRRRISRAPTGTDPHQHPQPPSDPT
jgi:hypothetical protein